MLALASLVAFFGAGVGESWGLDPCLHHDALGVLPAASLASGHDHTAPHAGSAGHDQPDDSGTHGDHGPCNCIGDCGPGSSAPLSVRTDTSLVPVVDTPVSATRVADTDRIRHDRRVWSPYFPNAPPFQF